MTRILITLALASSFSALAVDTNNQAATDPAGVRSVLRRSGMVMRPGTPKGRILVLNCQRELAMTNFVVALQNLGKDYAKWDVVCSAAEDPKGAFGEAKAAHKADIAVFVVNDEATPSLLQAPDDGWVAVNIARLSRNLLSEDAKRRFFESRCRKQIMRAVALACGAAGSTYPGNIMDVTKVEDLDIMKEFVPEDKADICDRYLSNAGFKAKQIVPYFRAVREGWAPAPTNDAQKAIWEKVHAIPDKPIKITYDKDREKPVVK